jgi:HK97 family phage major capsid protein
MVATMSLRKQIDGLQAQRNKHIDAMTALAELSAGENRLFTEDEQKAFDKAQAEVGDIDAQMKRLEAAEQMIGRSALAAPGPLNPNPKATPGIEVKPYKPFKGQGFVRLVLAVARNKGNMHGAAEFAAARWKDQTPEVELVLRAMAQTGELPGEVMRAAVAAGTTTNATWAGPLIYAQNLSQDFIEFLRPQTLLGKLPLRPVPFNVSIPRQTGGASAQWVGEGLSKPVAQLTFDRLPIPWAKTSVISVITDELARFSDPSAEMLVRDDLVQSIVQFLDTQFVDPSVAPSAGVRPGSITNGVAGTNVAVVPSTGVTVAAITADVTNLLKQMAAVNLPMTSMFWLMTPAARITLQNIRTSQDLIAFPELSGAGGTLIAGVNPTWRGYPVIESNNIFTSVSAPAGQSNIILLDASQIFHASDPVVDVQASSEASLQLDSAPATPPTPLVSMFQMNMLAIRAEQYQYWVRRHDKVVGYISGFQT